MAFSTGYLSDPAQVQGGEEFGSNNITISVAKGDWTSLVAGRFAQDKTGVVQVMDATATPNVVGVVKRKVTNATEDDSTIDASLFDFAEFTRAGLVSVDVKSGEAAPARFAAVQAWNTADADIGLAVASGGVTTNAEFVEDLGGDVWLIRLI